MDHLRTIGRNMALIGSTVLVWALLIMVYFEKFVPPFTFIERKMMPWRYLFAISAESNLDERLQYMEGLLKRSILIGNHGLVLMVLSFVALVFYATLMYNQKQQRDRETALLMMKNREIARRNEFIRYISATIGHEFKNNLGRIKRRLDLLDLPPAARYHIDGNLQKLFADINIFKKISDEREAGLIQFQHVDLRRLIEVLCTQYADIADITIECDLKDMTVVASNTLLRTVFENILDNAVKYRKPQDDKAHIQIICSLDSDGTRRYISISIRDQGQGMDELQADRCFYQGMETSGEGWGQGLYFVKYAVGLHAGKVRVGKEHTLPGEGTEIIIKLPYTEEKRVSSTDR